MFPAAAAAPALPLDDDNLLSEILLRLPPLPSSLPRASAVCKRWRGIASDPAFSRRFRLHHRRKPAPLLGCFHSKRSQQICFEPALEAPNRVPPGRFYSPPRRRYDYFRLIGCRHDLVLILHQAPLRFVVWDPVTGHQHRVDIPPRFRQLNRWISGAVLRPAAGDLHFQVVLVSPEKVEEFDVYLEDEPQITHLERSLACVYSSETGVWGDVISTPTSAGTFIFSRVSDEPAVLVGHSLYRVLLGATAIILEFDLERESLTKIPVPVDIWFDVCFTLMRAEDGELGLLTVSGSTTEFFKMNTGSDGDASWWVARTIELHKVLPLNSEHSLVIQGLAEDNNLVLLRNGSSLFTLQLESLQLKKLLDTDIRQCCPFESVYAAGI